MSFAVASYSFHGLHGRGLIDVFGYLETARYRYHLGVADIWNGMLASTDEDYILKIREAMDEKGMSLANLCCDWCQAWDATPEAREKNRANALAHLRAAVILGARTVRIDFGGHLPDMVPEQFDWVTERFREYAEFAEANGFLVGPENHYGPARVLENQLRVAQAVGSKAYGLLLHFGNWASDPDACDRAAAPWTIHTHIDAPHCSGDVGGTIRLLSDIGYQGCYSVEHHSATNEYAEVAIQLAQVGKAFAVGLPS